MPTFDNARDDLFEDFLALGEKYDDKMPIYEFGYALIQFASKMLMDCAPRYQVGLDTIQAGVESGIEWHSDEQKNKHGWKPRNDRKTP